MDECAIKKNKTILKQVHAVLWNIMYMNLWKFKKDIPDKDGDLNKFLLL